VGDPVGGGELAGVDHVTVESFGARLEEELEGLEKNLREGTYQPQALQRTYIKKMGSAEPRPLSIPTIAEEAQQVLESIRSWMHEAGLKLHPEKTRVADLNQREGYFDFLGYRFKRTNGKGRLIRVVRPKSVKKLREGLRSDLKRCNGHGLEEIIRRVNPRLRGWYNYFRHAHEASMEDMDRWVRMRLRSILRKRRKRKGRGRGSDHQRWPNAYFAELGLFSCATARETACQSATR